MAETLIDSYSEENQTSAMNLTAVDKAGVDQSFTGKTGKLSSCKFYLLKMSAPTGNVYAKLYSHSGTFGTSSIPNALLATSDIVDIAGISAVAPALYTFTFTGVNKYSLVDGTKYCIAITYAGGDGSNYLRVYRDATVYSHGGNDAYTTDLVTWTPEATSDVCFYVYAEVPEAGGFSGGQPWIFMKDMWEARNKLWIPKLSEGFSI